MPDDSNPRLLILTSTFPRWPGDHEPPFVYELARRLTDRFDVTVLAPHAPGARDRERMDGVAVYRFRYAPERLERLAYAGGIPSNLRRHRWLLALVPSFLLAQLFAAYRLSRSLRPVAVHAHWLLPGGLIGALLKRPAHGGPRLLVTAHGGDVYGLRHPLAVRLKRWVLERADRVTVVSAALADAARQLGVAPDKLTVLPMGTDLSGLFTPTGRHTGPPTLVYAGRLVEKKGIDTLLRAAAIVHRSIPALQITIAGHGPVQPALQALSEELGIGAIVRFSGPYRHDQLPQIYAAADLAVFPFRAAPSGDQDGLGLAVVEAMGCGVPVLGSDIAPLDDLLRPGMTALRAPTDDVEAFAAAILASLADPQAALERAAAARALVAGRFDWQSVAQRYAELLGAPLSRGPARPPRAES